jgi:ubiquinone/menaquinone biosynthesis C-methylase UbiE
MIAMLPRVLEPEVMDSAVEARDYDAMDHAQVNRLFAADFLAFCRTPGAEPREVLDVGTGTAQIPIELCRQHPDIHVVAVDLAGHMLALAQANIDRAGLAPRIRVQLCDAKGLPFADASFAAVISNSIAHHIPAPGQVLAEMVRVLQPGGAIVVRDLIRPDSDAEVQRLVRLYAEGANAHQRQMFEDSLRAALTVDEVRALAAPLGFAARTVQQTSDRHWTWAAHRPAPPARAPRGSAGDAPSTSRPDGWRP